MHTDLPIHPTTGLRALGVLPSGRVVWPVLGGSEEGDGGTGDGGQGGGDGGQGGDGGTRTFGQADVDRIVAERLARDRARYADYDDVKAKAAKYDEYQAAQQTDLEKLQGTHEEILGKLARTEHQLRVTTAAAKHGLGADAVGFLAGETDEEVDANAKKLAELTATKSGGTNDKQDGAPAGGRPDPSQGQGSSGDGTNSVSAGADRYRRMKHKT